MTDTLTNNEQVMGVIRIIAKQTNVPVTMKEIAGMCDIEPRALSRSCRELLKNGSIRKSWNNRGFVLLRP